MRRILTAGRPSSALVIAVLALFVSLAGVSYAVVKAPKNSVVTKSIKTGAVTLPKIAKSARKSLKAHKVVVRTNTVSVPNGFALNQKVQCNAGERATGGGVADPPSSNANSRVTASAPINSSDAIAGAGDTPTGWFGQAFNGSGSQSTYTIYVICASP
jgi:hypothetical protein